MTNGIWVLNQQHSIDMEEAKLRIRQKVKDFVAQYVMTLEKIKAGQDLSLDSRRLIEAMQYMISGNLIWGNLCPRYHFPTSKLSDFQLSRMKNVLGNRV
ncbi:Fusicoccadiene synthase [Beauveria bassiana]|uniref:Fusicoccadiene synthase n=1 Tax=Beauveria bassiana TaxID=176275 RepID=A0A2N6NK74_BEABA|nr:Fusicoccadiene synthase [Beauveria bassiana]